MPPWSCPRCGTVNAGQASACSACGTPNPAAPGATQQIPVPPQQYGQPSQQYWLPPPQQHGAPPGQYGAPPPYQTQPVGPPPAAPGWGAPPATPGGDRRPWIIGLVALAVAAAAAVAIVLLTHRGSSPTAGATTPTSAKASPSPSHSPSASATPSPSGTGNLVLPDTIDGESKINDPSLQASLQAQADSVRRAGASGAVAGAYGTSSSVPDRAVFAASGDHPTTAGFTHYLATQFAGGAEVTLDEATMKTIDETNATMTCWALDKGGSAVGAYCGWNDAVTFGFSAQFASPDLQTCADFTGLARTAILNQG